MSVLLRRIRLVSCLPRASGSPGMRRRPCKIVLLTNAKSPRWPMCREVFDRILENGAQARLVSEYLTWLPSPGLKLIACC